MGSSGTDILKELSASDEAALWGTKGGNQQPGLCSWNVRLLSLLVGNEVPSSPLDRPQSGLWWKCHGCQLCHQMEGQLPELSLSFLASQVGALTPCLPSWDAMAASELVSVNTSAKQ